MLFDCLFELQAVHDHIMTAGDTPQSDLRANAQKRKAVSAARVLFPKHEGISRAQKRYLRQSDRLPFQKNLR